MNKEEIIINYPDGSSYVDLKKDKTLGAYIFRLNTYEDLWHLNQFVDAYNFYHGEKPKIIIPCLIDAQADRRFSPSQSSGLKLVCEFLNSMNAYINVYHPHNAEVVEAYMPYVGIITNEYFITKVITSIDRTYKNTKKNPQDNLVLMSADAGGFKPLVKLAEKLEWKGELYSASKSRNGETGKLTQLIDRQDFQGKDILIVDDICVYGGTFKGLSKLLKERNCGKLYLAVSHMTVQELGNDSVTNYFDKVFTTNSKYESYDSNSVEVKDLEIIKIF